MLRLNRLVRSLRFRLFLLVLLAILPALGLTLYTGLQERQRDALDARENVLRLARLASRDQARFVEHGRELLVILADLPAIREQDVAACSTLFADLLKQYPQYVNLGMIAPNGRILCSGLPTDGALNLSDRLYFQRALQTRDFAFGDFQIGRLTGKATLGLGYPVLDAAGQVQSVVYAALDLVWLSRFAAEAVLPPGSTLTVIDLGGTILVRHPDPEIWVGRSALETSIVQTMLATRGEGTAEARGVDGVMRLYAFTPLESSAGTIDAYASVGIPTAVVFADADRALAGSLSMLSLVSVLALGAAWFGGGFFILRPVKALVGATKRLAAGDLSARSGLIHEGGELGQLAASFDEMVAEMTRHAAERERAKEELQQSEERLRLMADSLPVLISYVDAEQRYRLNNRVYEAWFGHPRSQILGKRVEEVLGGDAYEVIREHVDAALAGQAVSYEALVPYRDGGPRYISASYVPDVKADGVVAGFFALVTDITERRRAEEALIVAKARLEHLLTASPVVIYSCEPFGDYPVTFIGENVRTQLGYEPSAFIGDPKFWVDRVHPEDVSRAFAELPRLFEEGHDVHEYRFRREDGSYVWMRDELRLVRDPVGKPLEIVGYWADITERKRAEETLRDLSRQNQLILDSAGEGIYGLDREDRITFVNPAAAKMLGWDVERLIGRIGHATIHHTRPDGSPYPVEECPIRAAYKDGLVHPSVVDEVFWRQDGTSLPIEYSSTPISVSDSEGEKLLGAVVVFRNITERKRAEETLGRESRRAKALLSVASRLNSQLDLQGVVDAVCEESARALGVGAALRLYDERRDSLNLVAGHGLPLGQERYTPVPKAVYDKLVSLSGRTFVIRDLQALADEHNFDQYGPGEARSLATSSMLREGSLVGTLTAVTYGETRDFAEDELELLQGIADQAAQAVVNARLYSDNLRQLRDIKELYAGAQDLSKRFTVQDLAAEAVRTCVEVFGAKAAWVTRAEPDGSVTSLGTYPYQVDFLRQITVRWDDSPAGRGPTGQAIRSGSSVAVEDIATDPGFLPWREAALAEGFSCAGAFPLVSLGQSIGGLTLYSDRPGFFTPDRVDLVQIYAHQVAAVMEKARLYEEVRRHAADLEERVAERTAQLQETNAELNAFAHSVSHDLRAPLRSMQGFADALLEDYAGRLDPVGQDYARRIVTASRRLDSLIQDLLAYSRVSRTELELQSVSLSRVVTDALAQLEADLREREARVDVEEPLPAALGHHGTLVQVVGNLLANAVKFVAPGVQPVVRVWAEEHGQWVRLCVEDNGIGIAREHQERIFRVFERLHGVAQYSGTGIGLAIVRKGVERMGGRVGVASEAGQGSRFWVELPRGGMRR